MQVLETPRLELRPMRPDDLDALLVIFTDPNVMAAFQHPPFTREQMRRWLDRNLDHQATHGFGLFSVLLKGDRLLIGDCGLEVMELDGQHVAELGYDFRSDYWNQGYATEAARAVRDYALSTLQIPALVSLIRAGNQPSRRVAEKIGMRFGREMERHGQLYWLYRLTSEPQTRVA